MAEIEYWDWPPDHFLDKTDQVKEIEAILGFEFKRVYSPVKIFQDEYPPSYHEVMNPVREMIKDAHGGHIFLGKTNKIRGINLYGKKLPPDKLQRLLALKLPYLLCLNLNDTSLTTYTFTDKQPRLIFINLSQNPDLRSVRFEFTPTELVSLDMYDSGVEEIALPTGMDKLVKIDIARNKLKSFSFGSGIRDLYLIDLGNNDIEEIHFPSGFQELRRVSFYQNKLTSFSFDGLMPNIESLDFRGNQLTDLPDNIIQLESLQELYLGNNPWERIADAVKNGDRDNSKENVFSFLASIADTEETENLYEAKMILVGNGMVGKTSIRTRLIDPSAKLPEEDERTQGLDVDTYTVKELRPTVTGQDGNIDFKLNIWDFGGQGRYREIQQLFCSHRSLYLFVTSYDDVPTKRKEEYISFNYWLEMVTAYGFDPKEDHFSPVAMVVNKIDKGYPQGGFEKFRENFPHIHPVPIYISAKTLRNFPQLEETIRELIPEVSHDIFKAKRNTNWLEVKDELEEMKANNHIKLDTYLSVCQKHGLSEIDATTWLHMLHRIGVLIYFGENSKLKDWVILNPEWVKEAMYKVIDFPMMKNGILRPEMYSFIWPTFSEEERIKVVEMMLAYKLCYRQKVAGGRSEYVVPACLPESMPLMPEEISSWEYEVEFRFKPFVPAGTINKLIVAIQSREDASEALSEVSEEGMKLQAKSCDARIYENLIWKNNLIIRENNTPSYAHIEEDWEHKRVILRLKGEKAVDLYEHVEAVLSQLNQELINTRYLRGLEMEAYGKGRTGWLSKKELVVRGEWLTAQEKTRDVLFANPFNDEHKLSGSFFDLPEIKLDVQEKLRIQFITANPQGTSHIHPDVEHREIMKEHSQGDHRDIFEWERPILAATYELVQRALLGDPAIVHFAGHGAKEGIILSTDNNDPDKLKKGELEELFLDLKGVVQLVLLNACYSAEQAKVISQLGIPVIGTNRAITDEAAIIFASGLYRALGINPSIKRALRTASTSLKRKYKSDNDIIRVWIDGKAYHL